VLTSLGHTLAARPYVFAFLAAFFVIGTLNRGRDRTLLLLVTGYAIAFLSEFASIRWGIPYGHYRYLYPAMKGELILGGVPVWDSLSYVFLAYAAYETVALTGLRPRVPLAALVMTLADVMIDPIALRGDRWFLGRIFEYTVDGAWFGVPLSNFAGWYVVGWAILTGWEWLSARLIATPPPLAQPRLGAGLYYGVLAFIATVGIAIGEARIVFASAVFQLPVVFALVLSRRRRLSPRGPDG
jgi:putative membrane protein